MQDVPEFVRQKGLVLRDFLDQREEAIIDKEFCVRLNYEAYFFGNLWSRERFLSDPILYCGLLTDPVTRRRFRPRADSPRRRFEEVTYYFESEISSTQFDEGPEAYQLPSWTM